MNNLLNKFKNSQSYKNFYIVLGDRILSRGINLVLFVLIARTLGPEKYGVYSLITVSIIFMVTFFDLGAENIAVRFSGRYQDRRESIYGIYLIFKTIILLILFVVIILFPGILARIINKPEAQKYIFIIFTGFALDSYRFLLTSYFQSLERFFVRAAVNIGTFLFRLISIFILLQLSVVDVRTIAIFYAICSLPVIILFTKQYYQFIKVFINSRIDRSIVVEIVDYGKWIVLAALPTSLMMKLDFYVVTRFSDFEQIGLYNSAVQLVAFFVYIPGVFGTVFLPKVSKYKDLSQIKRFVKKTIKVGILISAAVLTIIPFAEHIFPFILGEKFISAIPYFQVLLFAFIFGLWTTMLGTVFYAMGKIKYMTFGAYCQLTVFVIGALIFAPQFGITGIVWSKVFANMAYTSVVVYSLFFNLRLFSK